MLTKMKTLLMGKLMTCYLWAFSLAMTPSLFVRRHYKGDLFADQQEKNCSTTACSNEDFNAVAVPWKECQCQCLPLTPTFRQDIHQCVDNLDECQLVPFQSPGTSENIPLVSMPYTGNYIHPSAEIILDRVTKFHGAMCHVYMEKYLGVKGWLPLVNLTGNGLTFQLVNYSKKIFLQFVGNEHGRTILEGHLIMVEFTCKTRENANIVPHPCAAFRVTGKLKIDHLENGMAMEPPPNGKWHDWTIIGLGAGLLGVTYVLAILVYLVVRKRHEKKISGIIRDMQQYASSKGFQKVLVTTTGADVEPVDNDSKEGVSASQVNSPPTNRLLSWLHNLWVSENVKFHGKKVELSSSGAAVPHDSAPLDGRMHILKMKFSSPECRQSPIVHLRMPASDDASRQNPHRNSGIAVKQHSANSGIPDPLPLLTTLRRSSRSQQNRSTGSSKIFVEQLIPEQKRRRTRRPTGYKVEFQTVSKGNLHAIKAESSGSQSIKVEGKPEMDSEEKRKNLHGRKPPEVPRKEHYYSLTDSMRRKAASCENVTVLTIMGANGKCQRSESQRLGWEKDSLGRKGDYRSLRKIHHWQSGEFDRRSKSGGNLPISRSESTCSIDGKRKSVSFDLHDTVIFGERRRPVPEVAPLPKALQGRKGIPRNETPFRNMTSFATLSRQSKSSEFLHVKDFAPQKSVISIARSESNAGDYGIVAVKRRLECGESRPLTSILKRSESSEQRRQQLVVNVEKWRPATTINRSQSVAIPYSPVCMGNSQIENSGRIPVKSLVDSFNRKTNGQVTVSSLATKEGHSLERRPLDNKRLWHVVNDDSGYHSSDSERSSRVLANSN